MGRPVTVLDYTVQEGDRDDDGISIAADALSLNGGAIRAADGTTDADLSHGAVAARRGHKVNGALASPPVVNSIVFFNPARSDTYELGETVALGVEFHRAVTVTGSPRLALIIGAQTRHAAYSTSWGDGRFLHFSYAVQEGDRDEDGIAIPANALALNGGTITDADGTAAADLAHAAESPGQHGGKVDGSLVTVPVVETISLISFPARGDTYELGEMVEVVVEFDGAVKATGEPQVALTIGTQTRYATYNGWGRDSLYFNYTDSASRPTRWSSTAEPSRPPPASVLQQGGLRHRAGGRPAMRCRRDPASRPIAETGGGTTRVLHYAVQAGDHHGPMPTAGRPTPI